MRVESPELDLPHWAGARFVIRSLVREAEQQVAKLEAGSSEEALHEFRVSLRRLRSLARAFRPSLARWVRRKQERRLRSIAGATSGARDAEVQLEWLERQRGRLGPADEAALAWLEARLEQRRQAGYAEAAGTLASRFRRLVRSLERSLSRPAGEDELVGGAPTFGALLGGLLREHAAELQAALEAVDGPFDVEHAHAARIAGKRLRYLLEPLRGSDRADARPAVTPLKELQDLLGELHDAHVLGDVLAAALVEASAERSRRAHAAVLSGETGGPVLRLASRDRLTRGLLALDARAAERATAAWSTLTRDWLPGRRDALQRSVTAVVEALSPAASSRPVRPRRFLLLRVPEVRPGDAELDLDQGWLAGPPPRPWLLRVSGAEGTRYLMSPGGHAQPQELSEGDFAARWPETQETRLTRRRLLVRGRQSWAVDAYGERGPVLAEFAGPEHGELQFPRWLGAVLVREVTGEKAYETERLAARLRRVRTPPPLEPATAQVGSEVGQGAEGPDSIGSA